jgi:hypothetical protein
MPTDSMSMKPASMSSRKPLSAEDPAAQPARPWFVPASCRIPVRTGRFPPDSAGAARTRPSCWCCSVSASTTASIRNGKCRSRSAHRRAADRRRGGRALQPGWPPLRAVAHHDVAAAAADHDRLDDRADRRRRIAVLRRAESRDLRLGHRLTVRAVAEPGVRHPVFVLYAAACLLHPGGIEPVGTFIVNSLFLLFAAPPAACTRSSTNRRASCCSA